MIKDSKTEEKILKAAREVFLEKGYDGSRMQEIADRAGINKALLHYYFRNKDKLFLHIFQEAFSNFFPKIRELLKSEKPFFSKIEHLIDNYITLMSENPFLPLFILREIARNPEKLEGAIKLSAEIALSEFQRLIDKEVESGSIIHVETRQLLMNIISMCIFPFAAKPLLKNIFNVSAGEYHEMMMERKIIVYNVIYSWLKA